LVYGHATLPIEGKMPFYKRPVFWAGIALAIFLLLQYIFW